MDFEKAFFVPGLPFTLVSVSALQKAGAEVVFPKFGTGAVVTLSGGEIIKFGLADGLYQLGEPMTALNAASVRRDVGNSHTSDMTFDELLHQRLGHVSWSSPHLRRQISEGFGASGRKH